MARKNYSIDEALRTLSQKHDVMVDFNRKSLKILKHDSPHAKHDVGNKSWGKVDFLVNYCGFSLERVAKF
jgi:hypothetical protein